MFFPVGRLKAEGPSEKDCLAGASLQIKASQYPRVEVGEGYLPDLGEGPGAQARSLSDTAACPQPPALCSARASRRAGLPQGAPELQAESVLNPGTSTCGSAPSCGPA